MPMRKSRFTESQIRRHSEARRRATQIFPDGGERLSRTAESGRPTFVSAWSQFPRLGYILTVALH
jgi:hypothetical protein